VANDAVVLSSEQDFDHLEAATRGAVRQEYLAG